MTTLTLDGLGRLLTERFGGLLRHGAHTEHSGAVCVRELRACALGMRWTDRPDSGWEQCGTDNLGSLLNDLPWPSDEARTQACLPLALLSEAEAAKDWLARLFDRIASDLLPRAIRLVSSRVRQDVQVKLLALAARCESEGLLAVEDVRLACEDWSRVVSAQEGDDLRGLALAVKNTLVSCGGYYSSWIVRRALESLVLAAKRFDDGNTAMLDLLRYAVKTVLACHRGL